MVAAATPGYVPYLIVAGIAFSLYRRVRSHFGRQLWRPARTKARIVLLALILAALAIVTAMHPAQNWGVALGGAIGAVLGLAALRLVQVDTVGGQPGYTPNPWIGAALTALLVGRIAWRFSTSGFMTPQPAGPLTFAIAATVVVFYLVQGVGLMRRMQRLATPSPASG